ncbi:PREDICTED: probable cyclic nucleotide-gated ion channel 10 isoform X2 [Camelina sativa]|uniref:Probable cyclic nucleotide-gated ion channel 10 isoform X1 n=1 Tax=Camelina sativa TaxID=90675 RepID=A0ABM0VXG6_CAMSA|nr:PREDICTED: probable cyclic nucleotide-gated ion channel 10 isoform X1 [Camelina sativa]XP_019091870.1 PREDICTED: probable cyclic nucleotide-gated ion channel 10 isoform X1 [Camelina sativa]XP_019091871.1 PREDICTED: probable cyclic nucleotide-gated ion channel 10 isoform X2 [Camelina sativa]
MMAFSHDNRVRFKDEERSIASEYGYGRKARPSLDRVLKNVKWGIEKGSGNFKIFKKPLSSLPHKDPDHNKVQKETSGTTKKNIINPQDSFLQNWNKIFLFACVLALAIDPLFFYIPIVDGTRHCLTMDSKLEIAASFLRTLIDAFYIIHIVFQFRTAYIAPSSRVFGRGELVDDAKAIALKYLSSYFIIDVLSILPLPQIVVLAVIPSVKEPDSLLTKDYLMSVIIVQYVPRILRLYPLYTEVTRTSGIVTETAWAGAAWNLSLYMLASHVFGALWYLISVEREDRCWQEACEKKNGCSLSSLYCHGNGNAANDYLTTSCPFLDPGDITNSTIFNFGIFTDALKSGVVESHDFWKKFFYCFWWGLRNLSALGQNLQTSKFVGEIVFAISICISGLVLFALLIGNMQKYLESTTVREEEMRVRKRDAEQWMSHRMLPEDLRKRIRRYEQYRWQETRGVEEENLLRNLPKDLRRDIKRHLCLDLLKKVPLFEIMDEQLLDAVCDRLKPVLYTENSYVIREGDPVGEMMFVMRGRLISATTNGGRTGVFNAVDLKASDFCGEDLLPWALDPQSSSHFPISTRTVQALTEVEAFALMAEDLKSVASQFRRLHSKQLQHTFRFYSVQWRTWSVSFIQAAWRRYCRKKLAKSLRDEEERLRDALAREGDGATASSSLSLGAALYASRFASNALHNLRHNYSNLPPRYTLPLLPQKPTEPDFTASHTTDP